MVLLSILGSYCIAISEAVNTIHEQNNDCVSLSCLGDRAGHAIFSIGEYLYTLSLQAITSVTNFFSPDSQNVTIQMHESLRAPVKKTPEEQDDSYYIDSDKCTGKNNKDCLFNAKFFGDTYFGTGTKNFDETLNIDYSEYPRED